MFKVNVGSTDRILRAIAGVGLIAFAVMWPGMEYQWLGWIGVPVLLIAVLKFCPAYPLFGINTGAKSADVPEAPEG